MEFAKTYDLLWIMQVLGYKYISNTQIYIHLSDFKGEEYYTVTAKTIDKARKLVESGFKYGCDIDGAKLFSKRK